MLEINGFYFYGKKVEEFDKIDDALKKLNEISKEDKDDYIAVGVNYKRNGSIGSCDLVVRIDGKFKISNDYKFILKDNQKEIEQIIDQQKSLLKELFSL